MQNIAALQEKALWIRRKVLEMAVIADSGHVSTAMSQCEILVALYFGDILQYDPTNQHHPDRDIFILSKGQGGIGLYPTLALAGFFPIEDLNNFTKRGSLMGVHAEWHLPGVEILSGSLGHGLPIATGWAQAFKNDGQDNKVYCLTGDGELHEGSNWEAMLTASWQKLHNLVVIVDRNGHCTLGKTDSREAPKDGPGLDNLGDKFEAFGFECIECDGHDFRSLLWALDYAKQPRHGQPLAIIANTKKGKGLSVLEDKRGWHYRVPAGDDLAKCWADLGVEKPIEAPVKSQAKHAIGMRDRFFDALFPLFKADKRLVMVVADNGAPALERFAAELPGQYFQVGIAEQEMVGFAAGLALAGKKVLCYAISPFVTTRIHEFVKLDACAMNLPITLVGVGAGWAYDIMSTSHHCTEDLAIMRVLPNLNIFSPADGLTAEYVAGKVCTLEGPSYVRMDRGGLPDLGYQNQVMCWSDGIAQASVGHDDATLVATGIMVHQAKEVARALQLDHRFPGSIRVLDVYQIKPLNKTRLLSLLGACVVTMEEHQLAGGLGSLVAETLADARVYKPLLRLGCPDTFAFDMGGRDAIWERYGLDVPSVVKRIKDWIGNL